MKKIKKIVTLVIALILCSMTMVQTIGATVECGCSEVDWVEKTTIIQKTNELPNREQPREIESLFIPAELINEKRNENIFITPVKTKNGTNPSFLAIQRDGKK